MNVVSAVLLVIFSVIGVISLVRELAVLIFRYKCDNTIMFITPINKDCNDAEFLLRSTVSKVRWISRGKHNYVVCLDCEMDDKTKEICENICKQYGFASLMSKKELFERLSEPVR